MPRLTLHLKVFLALALLLVVLLCLFAGFTRLGLQRGLGPYVAEIELARMDWLAERLKRNYAQNGNWNAMRDGSGTWRRLQWGDPLPSARENWSGDGMRRVQPGPFPFSGEPPEGWRPPFSAADRSEANPQFDLRPRNFRPPLDASGEPRDPLNPPGSVYHRLGLTDAAGAYIAGAVVDEASAVRLPLRHAGKTIGFLVLAPVEGLGSEADRAFLTQQSRFMIWTGVAGLALALALSWLLARRWFAPIGELMDGARGIAQGRLGTRIPARGQDELATLARTFNHMAKRLDGIEQSRRAWLAEAAHELRTPLAAMRAEIEAVQDGIRPFDDRTALRLHRQVMRLDRLVDDLRLSMGDGGSAAARMDTGLVHPVTLLRDAVASMRPRFVQAGIVLDSTALDALGVQTDAAMADGQAGASPTLLGDARRLHQVFMNLLENSLRYTDAGGALHIAARLQGDAGRRELQLQFDDSAPGVADDERALIFDRLFRGEGSRSRATGGSGLGLAICRSIVEAHGGRIEAAASALGGLGISVVLPLENEE